jgi:hypothetical protein
MAIAKELYNVKFSQYMDSIKIFYLVDQRFKTLCDAYCSNKINLEKHIINRTDLFCAVVQLENLDIEFEEEILLYLIRKNWD